MKKTTYLLLLLPALFLTGCIYDNTKDSGPATSLNGKWELISVTSPMVAETHTITDGAVIWQFDNAKSNITVISTSNDVWNPLPSGTHNYTINSLENVCDENLKVGETDFGCISLTNNTLVITTDYLDGNKYTFIK